MGMLTKEQLLTKHDLPVKRVELLNGDFVFVRMMTGREKNLYQQSLVTVSMGPDGKPVYKNSMDDLEAKLAVFTLCDENGELLFCPNDVAKLSAALPWDELEKISEAASRLNNLSKDTREEMLKNSSPGQSEDFTSDSAGS